MLCSVGCVYSWGVHFHVCVCVSCVHECMFSFMVCYALSDSEHTHTHTHTHGPIVTMARWKITESRGMKRLWSLWMVMTTLMTSSSWLR